MKRGLLVFARKAERGKVKTRLAATVGDDAALAIYRRLLQHTRSLVDEIDAAPIVFLVDAESDAFWNPFRQLIQRGNDLGERMRAAFDTVYAMGYQQLVIIGTDCPALTADIIHQAYSALGEHDVVIGPAMDGGYYLLGMTRLCRQLFERKDWSTNRVLAQTLSTAAEMRLSVSLLPTLHDVDEAADVPEGWVARG